MYKRQPRLYREALKTYRDNFRPSDQLAEPYAMLALPAVPAESREHAGFLATTSYQRILALFRGQPLWMKPPVASMDGLWSRGEEAGVKDFLGLQISGNAKDLAEQLQQRLADIHVNELMFTVDIYDPEERRQALDILAETRQLLQQS